jgi:DNA polymerase I-like protein with 3'-5' exonuclease and polymerase domains
MDLLGIRPELYYTGNYVVLDFEVDTSHGDFGHPVWQDNKLLLACWRTGPNHDQESVMHAHWGGEYDQQELLDAIESADFIVAHQAKYELGWLRRAGLDISKLMVYDTCLGEYVLMGNLAAGDEVMPPRSISLNECCIRRGWEQKDPVVDVMIGNGINPVRIPRPWLEGRCRQDVDTTERLFLTQRDQLAASNRLGVLLTRCLITPVLARMEFEGMTLDAERVEAQYAAHKERYAALHAEMEEFTGGLNWRSTKQVADFLYNPVKPVQVLDDEGFPILTKEGEPVMTAPGLGFAELRKPSGETVRTKAGQRTLKDGTVKKTGGARKTDQKTLDKLIARTPRQRKFVELRKEIGKVNAALVKNLKFVQGVCKEYGGTFYAQINQDKTATHRTSSTGLSLKFVTPELAGDSTAQFQNLPRAFKPLFTARRPGYIIAEADGAQLEFRVAAHLGNDAQAIADIVSGTHDVHKFTASILFGVPYDQVTKDQRQAAKPHTFKPLYGGQMGTEAEMRYYAAFRARYPQLAKVQEGWAHTVVDKKMLVTPWGMRYYWPYARSSNSGYINVTSAVYNYPVQALATAEIIPIALAYFAEEVQRRGLEKVIVPISTVHDSVICEIDPAALDDFKDIALLTFTTRVYEYLDNVYDLQFNLVPLGVGMSWGSHWGEKGNAEEEWNVSYAGVRQKVEK